LEDRSNLSNRIKASTQPIQVRRGILGFAVTLAIITYLDRVCISQAAPALQGELGLTAAQLGLAFSAFAWAYALFEIPGGWLGDRIGPGKVLMRVVIMWSVFTAATGCVWNLASLRSVRLAGRDLGLVLPPRVPGRELPEPFLGASKRGRGEHWKNRCKPLGSWTYGG